MEAGLPNFNESSKDRCMRKISFANGEYYHIYNRGTDKREIFSDAADFSRFIQSIQEFNVTEPIGSIYEHCRLKIRPAKFGSPASKIEKDEPPLVNIVAYCLNSNHYHFLIQQVSEKGVEKFMQRLGTGYTKYFNHKYDRTGVLFQGKFKAVHVDSNEYLLHVSTYVNLTFRVHDFGSRTSKYQYRSSWEEYVGVVQGKRYENGVCDTDPVLGQFRSREEYMEFAENSLWGTLKRRGFLEASALLE